jgi:hypothetical protein
MAARARPPTGRPSLNNNCTPIAVFKTKKGQDESPVPSLCARLLAGIADRRDDRAAAGDVEGQSPAGALVSIAGSRHQMPVSSRTSPR